MNLTLQRQRLRTIRSRKGIYGWDAFAKPAFAISRLRKALFDHYLSQIVAGELSPAGRAAAYF